MMNDVSRRSFLAGLAAAAAASRMAAAAPAKNTLVAPAFAELPLGEIKPAGWLRDQMLVQSRGMTGLLHENWPDVGPNSGWLGGTGEHWERGPYFLDGLLPLAYLLDDAKLKAQAQKFIEWTLNNQSAEGKLGPANNDDWWPNMVMLKVLMQYHEVTGDKRVLPAMQKYFAYQLRELPAHPLKAWAKFRWQDNVLAVLWLHDRSPDPKLIDLAKLLKEQGHDWRAQFDDFKLIKPFVKADLKAAGGGQSDISLSTHGVNNGQAIKTTPVWYRVSGEQADRDGLAKMTAALDKYHGQPTGMFSCDEHLAGPDPSQGTELCTVVETMYSLEVAMSMLGDAWIGDRIEKIAYNALPGTFNDDMTAHQYDQQANQVQCSLQTKPWTTDGPESNLYGKQPHFGCCTANFHQGWPKLTSHLWMKSGAGTKDEGLVAAVWAPCEINTTVNGVNVRVRVETEYPFRDTVRIAIEPEKAVAFPLRLRSPEWSTGHTVMLEKHGAAPQMLHVASSEDAKKDRAAAPSSLARFVEVKRRWELGDVVVLSLQMKPRIARGFHNSVAVERGPLVFSLEPGAQWMKMRDYGWTADYQVFPEKPWNFALAVKDDSDLKVSEHPLTVNPFATTARPVRIDVPARRFVKWRSEDGVAKPLPESPVKSDEPVETLTLVPYASAKLRVTAFPVC